MISQVWTFENSVLTLLVLTWKQGLENVSVSRGLVLQLANNSLHLMIQGLQFNAVMCLYQCLTENMKYGWGKKCTPPCAKNVQKQQTCKQTVFCNVLPCMPTVLVSKFTLRKWDVISLIHRLVRTRHYQRTRPKIWVRRMKLLGALQLAPPDSETGCCVFFTSNLHIKLQN